MHMAIHLAGAATLVLIAAFFVLAAAQWTTGFVKEFGNLLGFWLIVIASAAIVGAVSAGMNGGKPFGVEFNPEALDAPAASPTPTEPAPASEPTPSGPAQPEFTPGAVPPPSGG